MIKKGKRGNNHFQTLSLLIDSQFSMKLQNSWQHCLTRHKTLRPPGLSREEDHSSRSRKLSKLMCQFLDRFCLSVVLYWKILQLKIEYGHTLANPKLSRVEIHGLDIPNSYISNKSNECIEIKPLKSQLNRNCKRC